MAIAYSKNRLGISERSINAALRHCTIRVSFGDAAQRAFMPACRYDAAGTDLDVLQPRV
eukprot:gene16065-biopygen13562